MFGRKPTDADFIVFNNVGTVMEPDNLSHYFTILQRKLNLPHVKFHAIRHTFATRAIENGVAVSTVSGLLGHADVTTTTHYYVHPRDDAMRAAMRSIILKDIADKSGPANNDYINYLLETGHRLSYDDAKAFLGVLVLYEKEGKSEALAKFDLLVKAWISTPTRNLILLAGSSIPFFAVRFLLTE